MLSQYAAGHRFRLFSGNPTACYISALLEPFDGDVWLWTVATIMGITFSIALLKLARFRNLLARIVLKLGEGMKAAFRPDSHLPLICCVFGASLLVGHIFSSLFISLLLDLRTRKVCQIAPGSTHTV